MNLLLKVRVQRIWREWIKPVLIVVIVLFSFRSAVADWYDVPSGSMKPTILEGDRIFVNKLAYDLKVPFTSWRVARWGGPERSDVIVFRSADTGTRVVKRVIGLPGDRIEMRRNQLWVNETPIAYEPLDAETIAEIAPEEQSLHAFARERLTDEGHPVMSTPNLPAKRWFGPVTVPEDHYFVMGDCRDNSRDSRHWGFLHRDRILGKTECVVLSFDRDHYYLPRWGRFFNGLQ